jgi:hypothetical protein
MQDRSAGVESRRAVDSFRPRTSRSRCWADSPLRLAVLSAWLAVFSTGCGGGPPASEQRQVAEWVIAQGGTVVTDKVLEVKSADRLPKGSFEIRRIELKNARISDTDLEKLSDLTGLRYLGLYGTPVTDAGLQHLVRLQSLAELELSYTQVTDAGLIPLKTLNSLNKLYLTGTPVTDNGIEDFKNSRPGCEVYRL